MNSHNLLMFHMHCVDMNPCRPTCCHFDWIWQSTGLLFCMTHPYSWFGLHMTHPYRTARPIRTVISGELSTLTLNFQLLRLFSSMVFEQINSHMHYYGVTHRDSVFKCTFINLIRVKHTIFDQVSTNRAILCALVHECIKDSEKMAANFLKNI